MSKRILILAFLSVAAVATAQQHARNVILFLGDAGGIPVLNAASIYGHQAPRSLFIQHMPHIALSETSSASSWVTDSAAGMTAIVTGVKTNNGELSEMPTPAGTEGAPLKTLLEYAEEHGLSTGVVSNMPMSDATPAACYAHAGSRKKTGEIFSQVWKPRYGDGVDVVIGAGLPLISKALTELGLDLQKNLAAARLPLYASLDAVPKDARRAVVLFENDEFDLPAATDKAIEILSRNPKGYFLMMECDMHTDKPQKGLEHALLLDRYMQSVSSRVSKDTLLLFTADHSFDFRLVRGAAGKNITLPAAGGVAKAEKTDVQVGTSHAGEEVLVAAQGPGSEAVHGILANTDLFGIMMAAYGWKPDAAAAASHTH